MGETDNWDNAALHAALANTNNATSIGKVGQKLRKQVASWVEQRLYVSDYAVAALSAAAGASPSAQRLGEHIRQEMSAQWPVAAPNITTGGGFTKVAPGAVITTAHFTAMVSVATGGLSSLVPKSPDAETEGVQDWVGATNSHRYDLFQFVYRSLTQKDFEPFHKEVRCQGRVTCSGS